MAKDIMISKTTETCGNCVRRGVHNLSMFCREKSDKTKMCLVTALTVCDDWKGEKE